MSRRPRSQAGQLVDQLVAATGGSRDPLPSVVQAPEVPLSQRMTQQQIVAAEEAFGAPSAKKPPPLFVNSNGGGEASDFQRIIEAVYRVDAYADYDDLEQHLEVGEQRSDYATLREHLDKAEQRARRAHKLYLGAKIELVRWEADARKVMAAMREKARLQLEEEKADGARKKAIVKDDVVDRIADLYPDEWAAQEITRAKMKGVVEDMENLVKNWNSKCASLRTLLETLRK